MRRDHFHTDDGVPTIRWLPNQGRQKPYTDERIDQLAVWLADHDTGSRNEPAGMLARDRGRAVTFL